MSTPDHNEHAGRVSGMFGRIAGWYDFLNHFLSLGLDIVWRRKLVRTVQPGPNGRFLDLAAGTMDVTLELKRQHPKADVLSLDFSMPMLQKGAGKLNRHKYSVQPVLADGRKLPLADESVDAATIAFGIRNILPRQEAYAEILRALAPGGRLCILEFGTSRQPIWKGIYNLYLNRLLPMAGRIISGDAEAYRYLADTIRAFPTATELEDELRDAGFVNVTHEPLMSGIVNIHVAEKRRFTGDTFIVRSGRKAPAQTEEKPAAPRPAPQPAPKAEAAKARVVEPVALDKAADHVSAGLKAMEAAEKAAPKPPKKAAAKKPAKKAAAKPKAEKKTDAKAKAPAKKAAAKKASAKKAAPKKSADKAKADEPKKAKKTSAKKTATKKTAAKKSTAKKSAPKKSAKK